MRELKPRISIKNQVQTDKPITGDAILVDDPVALVDDPTALVGGPSVIHTGMRHNAKVVVPRTSIRIRR